VAVRALPGADGALRLEVADTGPGIPESKRERLFRPFAANSGRSAGHGLGLAIVRAVVERHQGRLEVEGGPGRGCTIAIVLPPRPAGGLHP
jgi:signal transduction histidine kinase